MLIGNKQISQKSLSFPVRFACLGNLPGLIPFSMQVVETNRLILRPFTPEDVEAAYEMNLDEAVSRYTGDGGVVSKAEVRRRITEDIIGDYHRTGYGRLAVIEKSSQAFMGFAGLKYLEDLKETDLGYRLMSRYWGHGYATEAARACLETGFTQLGLSRIIALVLPENRSSIRVLDKLGFVKQGEVIEEDLLAWKYLIEK